jgi:hypothetical protein
LLKQVFCRCESWAAEIVDRAAGMAPAAAGGVDPRLIGMTIEYAIGLDLAQDAYAPRRSLLPAAHAEWIAAQVDGNRMSRPRTSLVEPVDPPVGLLQSALHLARYDVLFYRGTERQMDAEVIRGGLTGLDDHPAHAALWRAAEPELGELWKLYAGNARGFLAARTPVSAAPVLRRRDGARGPYPEAIADFIAADTLVEVKAGPVDESSWRSGEAAIQMMRYAVLAPASGYPVKAVALYLARYGMLVTWELTDLAARLAGHPVNLSYLREQLCGDASD